MRATDAATGADVAAAEPDPGAPSTRRLFGLLVLATALVLVLAFGWQFLRDPHRLAITIDPAWYTWRGKLLLTSDPGLLILKHGPFGMLTGGYRIATPVFGAMLARVAGVDPDRYTVLLAVAMPVLASLGVAAFAYRSKRDPVIWLFTAVAGASLFFTTPFIGYMDDVVCLMLLAMTLPFLGPARTSWGARSAVALLSFLALMTHPTTTAIFVLTLVASTVIRWVFEHRFSVRRTLAADGPLALSVLAGLVVGAAWWKLGLWGKRAPFGESVLYQPYTSSFFKARLNSWIQSMHPKVTVPLAVIAIGWVVVQYVRGRPEGRDWHSRMSVLWLLPYVGVFGFVLGKSYPYYRFLNPTLAMQLLLGLGLWLLTLGAAWLWGRLRARRPGNAGTGGMTSPAVRWIATAVLLVVVATLYYVPGLRAWNKQDEWIQPGQRVDVAAAGAYAAAMPDHPIVFLLYPDPAGTKAWGVSKQGMNITLGGLPGDQPARTFFFVGSADDYLAGRATVTNQALFDRLSRNFLADAQAGLRGSSQVPVVLVIKSFNLDAPTSGAVVPVTGDVSVVQGAGAAPLDPAARAAAVRAEAATTALIASKPGALSGFGHLLRVLTGLLVLLVLPGLLAARWFGVGGLADGMALVPGLSFALSATAGILVLSVTRSAMTSGAAWIAAIIAVGAGAVFGVLARRRPGLLGEVSIG
jgi:hypothetical protein